MPTYDYVCTKCDNKFEAFHSMTAEPLKECPKCGGYVEKKISGGTGLVFKGSGFYITDYKNKSKKNSSEKKPTETKSKNKETKKNDSKS